MNITFKTRKLGKTFNEDRALQGSYGKQADVIKRRMAVLVAAMNLGQVSHLPPERCHELHPLGIGLYAVDLKHPWRLIFRVANDPVPRKEDQGIDIKSVTSIEIQSVEDYH